MYRTSDVAGTALQSFVDRTPQKCARSWLRPTKGAGVPTRRPCCFERLTERAPLGTTRRQLCVFVAQLTIFGCCAAPNTLLSRALWGSTARMPVNHPARQQLYPSTGKSPVDQSLTASCNVRKCLDPAVRSRLRRLRGAVVDRVYIRSTCSRPKDPKGRTNDIATSAT